MFTMEGIHTHDALLIPRVPSILSMDVDLVGF